MNIFVEETDSMKKIIVKNSKGGCGKTSLVAALADVLGAQIVDLDPQKTLTYVAEFTRRLVPIQAHQATAAYIVYDTPPYLDANLGSVLKNIDVVLIPVLIGYPDLLATKSTVDEVCKLKLQEKTTLVFNKVRKPYNKSYYTIKEFFMKNYPQVKIAKTELSELKAFQDVLVKPLEGLAKQQISSLIQELFR